MKSTAYEIERLKKKECINFLQQPINAKLIKLMVTAQNRHFEEKLPNTTRF